MSAHGTDEDDDIDPAEWDRWIALTEEQQNAELEAADRQYNEMVGAMSHIQYYRHVRRMQVRTALKQRRVIRQMPHIDVFREQLKASQVRMVKLRSFLKTGIHPGEA